MRRALGMIVVLLLAACGGGVRDGATEGAVSDGANSAGDVGAEPGGNVVDPQLPGHAIAVVDGLEYSFELPGGLACAVSGEEFGFSYVIGDNEVGLGGGASISGGQWFGSLTLRVFADNAAT